MVSPDYLQALKNAILQTYPNSDIHGDGQVVVINFSDGIKFEVLPAFSSIRLVGNWNGKYDYPDSNMGGNWLTTNPKKRATGNEGKMLQAMVCYSTHVSTCVKFVITILGVTIFQES